MIRIMMIGIIQCGPSHQGNPHLTIKRGDSKLMKPPHPTMIDVKASPQQSLLKLFNVVNEPIYFNCG